MFGSRLLNFSNGDAIAATYCALHKTLAFGLPLLNTIFEGGLVANGKDALKDYKPREAKAEK